METVLMVTRLKTVLGFLTATIFNSVQVRKIFFSCELHKKQTTLFLFFLIQPLQICLRSLQVSGEINLLNMYIKY